MENIQSKNDQLQAIVDNFVYTPESFITQFNEWFYQDEHIFAKRLLDKYGEYVEMTKEME